MHHATRRSSPARATRRRRIGLLVAAAAWAVGLAAVVGAPAAPRASLASAPARTAALPAGTPNPAWPQGCGLRVGVSIDRSNSIANDDPANVGRIVEAVSGLVEGLGGTAMEVGVWSFGTAASGFVGPNPIATVPGSAIEPADYPSIGFTSVATATGRDAVGATVRAIPFASEASPEAERLKGWTDWEAGFGGDGSGFVSPGATAPGGDQPGYADLLLFVTDGSPTLPGPAGDPDRWGPEAPVVEGVAAADAVKVGPDPTRVVAIGVGSEVDVANLERISGGLGTSVAGDDYFFIAHYQDLLDTMLASIARACGGSVEVVKQVPGAEPGSWQPASGRPFTLGLDRTPPSGAPSSDPVPTGADGTVTWSWIGDGQAYRATVGEPLHGRHRLAGSGCTVAEANQGWGEPTALDEPVVEVLVPNGGRARCTFRNYVADPQLSLAKSVAPSTLPTPGGLARYRLEVHNTSPQQLERIRLTTLVDDRVGDLFDVGNPTVHDSTCPALAGAVLDPGAATACHFTAHVTGAATDPHLNVATVVGVELPPGGGEGLTVSADDDAEVGFEPLADLAVVKQGDPPTVRPGAQLRYSVAVTNLGPDAAGGVQVVDRLDPRTVHLADDGGCDHHAGVLTCPVGELGVGEERSIEVTVAVDPAAEVGTPLRNVVEVVGDQPDPDPDNDRDEVLTWLEVDLLGEKRTAQVPAEVPDAGATYDLYETTGTLPAARFAGRVPPGDAPALPGWRWWARVVVDDQGQAPVTVVGGAAYCFVEHTAPERWVRDDEPRCIAVDGTAPPAEGAPGDGARGGDGSVVVSLPEPRLLITLRAHKFDALDPGLPVPDATYEVMLVEAPDRPIHADWSLEPPPDHEPVPGLRLVAMATTDARGDISVEVPAGYAYCLREVEVPTGYRSDPSLRCTDVLDGPAQADAVVVALPEVPDDRIDPEPTPGPDPDPDARPDPAPGPGPEERSPRTPGGAPAPGAAGRGAALPVTGASVGLLVLAGLSLALGGSVLTWRRRRGSGPR